MARLDSMSMIALDMDGTLLNAQHTLSATSIRVLRSLSSRGIDIALCSGRSTLAIVDHARQLALPRAMPVVSFNGACGLMLPPQAADLTATRQMFATSVSAEAAASVIRVADELGLLVQYYVGDDIYVACKHEKHVALTKRYAELVGVSAHKHVQSYAEAQARGLAFKLLIMTGEAILDETLASLRKLLSADMIKLVRGSPPWFIECLNPATDKGAGLVKMCAALNVPLAKVVAFGDGDNDLEFLSAAGLGVAMLNAPMNVQDVADRVTERTNDDDGVAATLMALEASGELFLPAPRTVKLRRVEKLSGGAGEVGAGVNGSGVKCGDGLPLRVVIRRVNAADVIALRESVLWPGRPDMCALPEDESSHAVHLAAMESNASKNDEHHSCGSGCVPIGVLSLFLPRGQTKEVEAVATHEAMEAAHAIEERSLKKAKTAEQTAKSALSAQFRKLAVDPAWRSLGLGSALVQTAAAEARLAGASTLMCHARAPQESFYGSIGFARVGQPFAKYGGEKLYVEMELQLTA
eukprot:TRINITY_DN32725_c0_g1_i1.p1 TRINITY_DN32725_c0_g1~~TRINITY_DN32725_c0_g1_i1.p1  ORF type:complete len:524 (+),score=74.41 TRINITY_DN32725_c0_g1_i1:136-1707(+)